MIYAFFAGEQEDLPSEIVKEYTLSQFNSDSTTPTNLAPNSVVELARSLLTSTTSDGTESLMLENKLRILTDTRPDPGNESNYFYTIGIRDFNLLSIQFTLAILGSAYIGVTLTKIVGQEFLEAVNFVQRLRWWRSWSGFPSTNKAQGWWD